MIDEYEVEDLKAEVAFQRQYNYRLAAHHDCRDPDHPGCENCRSTEDEE